MLDAILFALQQVFFWKNFLYVSLGTAVGLIFGAIPGLSSVISLSLFLPLTYGMDPMSAMFLYSGLMGANPFGGSISALLVILEKRIAENIQSAKNPILKNPNRMLLVFDHFSNRLFTAKKMIPLFRCIKSIAGFFILVYTGPGACYKFTSDPE